jgi:hypothetical protein
LILRVVVRGLCANHAVTIPWTRRLRGTAACRGSTIVYTEGERSKRGSLIVDAGNPCPIHESKPLTAKQTRHCGTVLVMTGLRSADGSCKVLAVVIEPCRGRLRLQCGTVVAVLLHCFTGSTDPTGLLIPPLISRDHCWRSSILSDYSRFIDSLAVA